MEYRNLSGYLKEKYGTRVGKICIDGGFTCPNRDGSVAYGGCIFCGERGAGEHIRSGVEISRQVREHLSSAEDNRKYIAYFQNFTNTYAPVEVLRERYDAALIDERIVLLAIGTRPDCITEEIAALIASYRDRVDVWVELGLQSASDETAKKINRGYDTSVYMDAVKILHGYGIPVVTHLMIGLPDETEREICKTVEVINRAATEGIKIHSVYVAEGTKLAELYRKGEYTPISRDEYTDLAVYVLTHVSPDVIIHRLTGDCPRDMLVAPEWNSDKNAVLEEIRRKMETGGVKQGSFYKTEAE